MSINKIIKVRLLLEDRGFVLFLKQTTENGGKYTLVGGEVEDDELPKAALVRETLEEAGIKIYKDDLKLVHTLFKKKANNMRIVLYFKASKYDGVVESKEPHKFKKAAWLPLHDLPPNTSPTVRHFLQQYKKGKSYSSLKKG